MYSLEFEPAAFRIFKKLPKEVQEAMANEAQALKTNSLAGEPLTGKYKYLRSLHFTFKGSAYRIIYQVLSKTSTIAIRLAATRENIYRRLDEMNTKPR